MSSWGFPKMVVPNNHGFSYEKWSFWGVLGVPPFTETPSWVHCNVFVLRGEKINLCILLVLFCTNVWFFGTMLLTIYKHVPPKRSKNIYIYIDTYEYINIHIYIYIYKAVPSFCGDRDVMDLFTATHFVGG